MAQSNPVKESLDTTQLQSNIDLLTSEFWKDVYPIFEKNCLSCHGPQKQFANFRVDRSEDFFGKNGREPLVFPKQSSKSPLIVIVSGARKDMPMADMHKLPEQDIAILKTWIDSGAEWTEKTDVRN